MKRTLYMLLAFIMLLALLPFGAPSAAASEFVSGVIPEPYTLTYPEEPEGLLFAAEPLPASHISVAAAGVRDQYKNGICWTFAATAAIEANAKQEHGFLDPDVSEQHMAYALSNSGSNPQGFNRAPGGGGHRGMSSAYLMRGGNLGGAVPEANDKYSGVSPLPVRSSSVTQGITEQYKSFTVNNIMFLSDETKINSDAHRNMLKAHIMDYGAVACSMYWDGSSAVGGQIGSTASYNSEYGAYYFNGNAGTSTNHAVTLVGWDDGFSKTNFNASRRPANDGAWLVKNSWGTDWGITENGQGGYFWISYEDARAPVTSWVVDGVEPFDPFTDDTVVHEYDPMGFSLYTTYASSSTVYGANIFTIAGGEPQTLDRVKYFVPQANTTVSIYVVPVFTGTGSLNTTGATPILVDELLTYAGWYTHKLSADIPLTDGKFAVIIKYNIPAGAAWIPMTSTKNNTEMSYASVNGATGWSKMVYFIDIKAVTKPQSDMDDADAVAFAKKRLTWGAIRGGNTTQSNVRTDLHLPTTGVQGTDISWESDDPSFIANDGTVTRPGEGEPNAIVELTATISKISSSPPEGAQDTVLFRLTVRAENAETEIVIVPSITNPAESYIDLTNETITLKTGYPVAGYSVNGGRTWKKGALPTGNALKKLFNKETTLWVTNTINTKKKPVEGAGTIKFPTISARPKANAEKLGAFYETESWYPKVKPTKTTDWAEPQVSYEFVKGNESNGKMPAEVEWEPMDDYIFEIISKPEGKVKNVYYFRSMAVHTEDDAYIPPGKAFKIAPSPYRAAPKYKINYKTEALNLKKDDQYSIGGDLLWQDVTVVDGKPVPLGVSGEISKSGMPQSLIRIRKAASGKKPPSEVQEISPLARPDLVYVALECYGGKITKKTGVYDLKKYEILGKDKKGNDKWGGMPKITGSDVLTIRLKPTAKLTKAGWTGAAASDPGSLTITWGVYGTDKKGNPKMGITGASISTAGP